MYEHSECRAIEVVGQDWSSEVVALFLDDWELGRVALSCHMAMDLLCQENEGLLVNCAHRVGKTLSQKIGRVESQESQQTKAF